MAEKFDEFFYDKKVFEDAALQLLEDKKEFLGKLFKSISLAEITSLELSSDLIDSTLRSLES